MPRLRIPISLLGLAVMLGPAWVLAQEPPPKQPPKKEKKVWTNDDLEALRNSVHLSELGSGAVPATSTAAEGTSAEGGAKPAAAGEAYSRENDPAWYQKQAATLRAELDRIDGEIRRLQDFKNNPSSGSAGMALDKDNLSLTPENQLAQLQARRRQVQQELDDLEATARRKGFPAGLVR